MKNNQFGFGIIGCGVISSWHAQAIAASTGGYLVGAVDIKPESRDAFCLKYGIHPFETVEDMLDSPDIDIVCICTPSGFHARNALAAIKAGKHVLIEKPMALNTDDCDAIIEAAGEANVKAGVVSQFRFARTSRTMKALIAEGRLGRVVTADLFMKYYRSQDYYDASKWRGTWELDGGGALMNQGIHGIDTILNIMGPVKCVYGMARTLARNIEVEDTASAVLEYANGALGIVQGTTSVYPGYPREIVISGTRGTVGISEDIFVEWNIEGETIPPDIQLGGKMTTSASNDPRNISTEGHKAQINDFIEAIVEDRRPAVDLREGRRAVELITAIYESSRTQTPVTLQVHM